MTQVAKKQESNIVVFDSSIFEQDQHSGMENMTQDDCALPFLKLLSQLSPELETIEGAKAGMIYNTVSGKVYDGKEGLLVIPCFYERRYIEWQPRGQGSGAPVNIYPATSDIMTKTFRKQGDSRDYLENGNYIENTAQHYVIVCDDKDGDHPALIVMKATQLKKSRKWNSMMMTLRMNGKNGPFVPPAYSHVYRLTTSKESNDKGTWFGWEVERVGPVEDMSRYQLAKGFAESVKAGQVEVKHSDESVADKGADIF